MDIKAINPTPNPLSEKIIPNGDRPFKLWLEFEETTPWNDLENGFANIGVDTLDGRCYGINVWTFKFLETAQQENSKEGNANYVIPPDLFVKELTRPCIEETISALLNEGYENEFFPLENQLNLSIWSVQFKEPYEDLFDPAEPAHPTSLAALKKALPPQHPLTDPSIELLARNKRDNHLVLEGEDSSIIVVELPAQPYTTTKKLPKIRNYNDSRDFWYQEMKKVINPASST